MASAMYVTASVAYLLLLKRTRLAGAGLILLLAAGPRLLVPRATDRIERRSPLEHVEEVRPEALRAEAHSRDAARPELHRQVQAMIASFRA